jgi:hypothetical protein
MDTSILSPSLQYGAFAILAIVISAFMYISWHRDKQASEQLKSVLDRQKTDSDFIRDFAKLAYDSQVAAAENFRCLTVEITKTLTINAENQQKQAESLAELTQQISEYNQAIASLINRQTELLVARIEKLEKSNGR